MKLQVFFIVCLMSLQSFAQEEQKPFQVSPLIGDTLDAFERNYYKLLPTIKGFQWAVFYLHTDSSLDAQVRFAENGVERDTVIQQYRTLYSLQNYFLSFEKAKKETGGEQGAAVVLFLRDEQQISGELLSVRDSALAISLTKLRHQDTSYEKDDIRLINRNEIQKVVIAGKSNVSLGIGIGLAAGGVVGLVVGLGRNQEVVGIDIYTGAANFVRTLGFTIGGAGIGSIIGYAVGSQTSSKDKYMLILTLQDMQVLRAHAKFLKEEPEYLRKIK